MKKLFALILTVAMLAMLGAGAMAEDLTIGVNIQEFSNAYLTSPTASPARPPSATTSTCS